ncbi:hypothetical protein [Gordonia aurantiaca]|uniref:hypothetical protein n=1 Tax=Gordonia sp. B21 TaxID=3151852 RepID=UPI003267B02F
MQAHAKGDGLLLANPATHPDGVPTPQPAAHDYLTHAEVEELAQRCGPQGDTCASSPTPGCGGVS